MSVSSFIAGLVVGLILLVVACWLWNRKKVQLETDQEEQAEALVLTQRNRDLAEREQEAQSKQRVAQLRTDYEQKILELNTAHAQDLEHLRTQLAQGIGWEETSRLKLAKACETLGVDGSLATNVSFLVHNERSKPYVHQIDHLIVADRMLFIVEAKHWKGTIYHREQPDRNCDPAAVDSLPMLDHVGPGERYVLRVNDDGSMMWFPNGTSPEPVKQVQSQSIKFKNFLAQRLGGDPGETFNCVLYSHPRSTLTGGARAFGRYTWITQPHELPMVLTRLQQRRASSNTRPVDVEGIHEIVSSLGADIVGLGSFAEQWQSPLPLGYGTGAPE